MLPPVGLLPAAPELLPLMRRISDTLTAGETTEARLIAAEGMAAAAAATRECAATDPVATCLRYCRAWFEATDAVASYLGHDHAGCVAAASAAATTAVGGSAPEPAIELMSGDAAVLARHAASLAATVLSASGEWDRAKVVLEKMSVRGIALLSSHRYNAPDLVVSALDAVHRRLKWKGQGLSDSSTGSGAAAATKKPGQRETVCEHCGRWFKSRNALFKHIRDLANPCGRLAASSDASFAPAPPPPPDGMTAATSSTTTGGKRKTTSSTVADKDRKRRSQKDKTEWHARRTGVLSDEASELWLGDIPSAWATRKALGSALYLTKPPGMPQPHIRKIVKKGYRVARAEPNEQRETSRGEHADADGAGGTRSQGPDQSNVAPAPSSPLPSLPPPPRGWLGYAFVVFRDEAEADQAIAQMHGKAVDGASGSQFRLRFRRSSKAHPSSKEVGNSVPDPLHPQGRPAGADPPLEQQLAPSCLSPADRTVIMLKHANAAGLVPEGEAVLGPEALAKICNYYITHPRVETAVDGDLIPSALERELSNALKVLRWPPVLHRGKLDSERYLLLCVNESPRAPVN